MGSDPNAIGGPERADRNSKIVSIINATYDALPENEAELQDRIKNSGLSGGLTDAQIDKLIAHYKSSAVTASDWSLPSDHGKWNCVSLSAYFVQRFTEVGHRTNVTWGNGRDVAHNLKNVNNKITTGTTPKPFSIFSTTSGDTMCGSEKCGHTGVILRVDGDMVTFIEAAYSLDQYTGKQTKPLSYFVNTKYSTDKFAYIDGIMDYQELQSIVGY